MQPNNVEGEVLNPSNSLKETIITPLCKPTPLSKYLALALFIVLPFVGGLVGYNLAKKEVVEVATLPTLVSSRNADTLLANTGKSLRYIELKDWNEYLQNTETFSKVTTLNDVVFEGVIDEENIPGQAPYFVALLASTPDYMIFCRLPFEKGGSCNGLYRYKISDRNFAEMNTSNLYNPYTSGGVLSPDQTKIAVVPPASEAVLGTKIGYIDLESDTFSQLRSVQGEDKNFLLCDEVSCGSEITWIDSDTFTVNVYEYCVAFNVCLLGGDGPRVPSEVMEINIDEADEAESSR